MRVIEGLVFVMVAAVVAGGPIGAPAPAVAVSTPSGIDPRLRLDWEAGAGRGGRTVIQGYVYNDYGRAATDVHLLVETLDASGATVARTIGFVQGTVQFNSRVYFEVPIKVIGASYRVTVTSFEWRAGGAGGGM